MSAWLSGTCFADFGHDVTCVDKDTKKIESLKRGEMPIYELGLRLSSWQQMSRRIVFVLRSI